MEYKIVLILLVLGAAIFSGCVEDKTKYYNQEFNETITLYKDNTVTITYPDSPGISGTYRWDGNHVILSIAPFGTVIEFQEEGANLVRINPNDRKVWVRV